MFLLILQDVRIDKKIARCDHQHNINKNHLDFNIWIPALSKLAGCILDHVTLLIQLEDVKHRSQ